MRIAIKVLKPQNETFNDMRKREIYLLHTLRGLPNIIHLIAVFKDADTGTLALATEYMDMNGTNFMDYCKEMTPYEMRFYMYQLF